jgi:RHS repeat-associated protein
MRAPPYRPDIGRFLTEDRFEAAAGDVALQSEPLTNNRYAFAGGNPVNHIEFDGHDPPTSYNKRARQVITGIRPKSKYKGVRLAPHGGPDDYYGHYPRTLVRPPDAGRRGRPS